jgi:hypothetical protein
LHRPLTIAVVLIALAAAAATLRAQGNDPFVGTWVLDIDKSTYEPANTRPARRHLIVTMNGDQVTHTTDTWRDTGFDLALRRVTYTARYDGREVTIPDSGAIVALKRINPTTVERTAKAGGQALETATWTVSADGKTLTVKTEGVDGGGTAYSSTQVYARQAPATR